MMETDSCDVVAVMEPSIEGVSVFPSGMAANLTTTDESFNSKKEQAVIMVRKVGMQKNPLSFQRIQLEIIWLNPGSNKLWQDKQHLVKIIYWL